MIRTIAGLLVCTAFFTACSPAKKEFGQAIIDVKQDTLQTMQEIRDIKSLSNDLFEAAAFTGKGSVPIRYRLYKPARVKPGEKYPLVVIYHGSGQPIGTDNISQLGLLAKLFIQPAVQARYPAYVLVPQFATRSSDYVMDNQRKVLTSIARPCLQTVFELIDSLRSQPGIDDKRMYAAGFSMGGSTVVNSLCARPDLFAAGISIAGIPQFDKTAVLSGIPLWLIHGMDDTENPIDSDEQLYKEIKGHTRFWKLKATKHNNIFNGMLLGETLPGWLFKQKKQ